MSLSATLPPPQHTAEHPTCTGIDNKKLIMWLFLASDCMFFGTLISTHLIFRKFHPEALTEDGGALDILSLLNIELTSFSTFILLLSSLLMALAVSAAHKGQLSSMRRMLFGVIVFGLIFLGCQVYEFAHFVHLGLTLQNSIYGATFYVLTGTHGVHVAGGIIWLTLLLIYSFSGKMTSAHAIDIEVAGLYWHFVDIVWIIIFTAVYLIEYVL